MSIVSRFNGTTQKIAHELLHKEELPPAWDEIEAKNIMAVISPIIKTAPDFNNQTEEQQKFFAEVNTLRNRVSIWQERSRKSQFDSSDDDAPPPPAPPSLKHS